MFCPPDSGVGWARQGSSCCLVGLDTRKSNQLKKSLPERIDAVSRIHGVVLRKYFLSDSDPQSWIMDPDTEGQCLTDIILLKNAVTGISSCSGVVPFPRTPILSPFSHKTLPLKQALPIWWACPIFIYFDRNYAPNLDSSLYWRDLDQVPELSFSQPSLARRSL